MNISTDMLSAFVKVAERLSVSAAAQELGVGKGVVSKRLAQLEDSIKTTLVTRNSRKLALTPCGLVYLDFAKQALFAMQQADEGLRNLRDEPTGRIRVTAPVSWGMYALGKALPDFLSAFPQIEVELLLQDKIIDIAHKGIDIALRMTATPSLDLVSIPVAQLSWVICAAPAYIATAGEPHQPSDLSHHPCMNYWSVHSDDDWRLVKGEIEQVLKVRNRYRANNPEAIMNAVLAGLGIALLPKYCCEQALTDGRLVAVLSDWAPVTKFGNQITAVLAPDRVGFSRNQAFLKFLKSKFSTALI
jgi:DNA-binding transcriptional LysR family regulator